MKTKTAKKTKLTLLSKAYSIDYMIKNPPANSKGLKYVWQAAVIEYMKKEGVDLTDKNVYHKPFQGIDFAKIVRIFKSLSATKKGKSKIAAA